MKTGKLFEFSVEELSEALSQAFAAEVDAEVMLAGAQIQQDSGCDDTQQACRARDSLLGFH